MNIYTDPREDPPSRLAKMGAQPTPFRAGGQQPSEPPEKEETRVAEPAGNRWASGTFL